MNTLRLFPKMVIMLGIAFALAGLVTAGAGLYIHSFVGEQLAAQQIVTPEDASIPNTPVTDIATALSMADVIQHHAADSSQTGTKTFSSPDHSMERRGEAHRAPRPLHVPTPCPLCLLYSSEHSGRKWGNLPAG